MPIRRAAAVAVIYGDLILLGKRCTHYKGEEVAFGGYWSVFSGTLEEGEGPIACAARELFEETQIRAPVYLLNFIKTFFDNDLEFTLYSYEVDELVVPVLDFEHTEHGWFKIDSLENFTEKIDSKIVECIEIYRRKKDDQTEYFRKSAR